MSYLTSGELAKLLKVSKYLLRHYEDQQLIQPAFIDINGYHMYGEKEVYTMAHLLLLKELGFSLKEMKSILLQKMDYSQALSHALQNVEKEMQRLTNLKSNIHSILKLQQKETYQITKENRETRYFTYLQDEYVDEAYNLDLKKLAKWKNDSLNIAEELSYAVLEDGGIVKVMYDSLTLENANHIFSAGLYYCKKIHVEQESDLEYEIQTFYEELAQMGASYENEVLIREEAQLSTFYLNAMVYSIEVKANE
ncbi:MerR family transcriptional regulator [Bacillus sp. B1-b2]|uniref:MerR family transcriptional regulator n=1 Tax=Bacillus sp. B1-b2 TaxID=2653201 RepID=UPI001262ABC2|nr:MerR family transcriptional regulator [Bacillus sp. B1-b2]KAB7672177.1 MerR family transcriptional regulator [Bacillus sp. B1-b2]